MRFLLITFVFQSKMGMSPTFYLTTGGNTSTPPQSCTTFTRRPAGKPQESEVGVRHLYCQASQKMTAHKKDLVLCNNRPSLLYWPSILHTFPVTPALGIKDPSTVSLAAFTSERGPIMEQLGEEWLGAGRLTDVGGG